VIFFTIIGLKKCGFIFFNLFLKKKIFNVVFKIQPVANAEVTEWKNRFSPLPAGWQFRGEEYLSSLYFKSILTFCDYEVTFLSFQCSYKIRNPPWVNPCPFVSFSFPGFIFLKLELTFMEASVLSAGNMICCTTWSKLCLDFRTEAQQLIILRITY